MSKHSVKSSKSSQKHGQTQSQREQKINQISNQQLKQLKMMFDYFDTDQSGALDTNEFQQFIQMIMGSQSTQQQRLDLLAQLDQDGNGSIQYQEFQSLFKKKLMKTNFMKEMQLAFQLIDIQNTQYISFQELERICNQLNMDFSTQDIRLMVEKAYQADPGEGRQRQKGKIFFKQFVQMMSQNQS